MNLIESIILVLLILVILHVSMARRRQYKLANQPAPVPAPLPAPLPVTTTNSATPAVPANKADDSESYESKIAEHMKETIEGFQVCGGYSPEQLKATCDESSGVYAQGYGNDGMDYNAYAASQAVDTQVVRNHAEFIKNIRGLGPNGEFTGRTYSPDSHDSYDPIPWVGLRRPEYVSVCNPTSTADVDYNLYKGNRKFCLIT